MTDEAIILSGTVSDLRKVKTFKGSFMSFFSLDGKEIVAFPKIYEEFGRKIHNGEKIKISVKKNNSFESQEEYILNEVLE